MNPSVHFEDIYRRNITLVRKIIAGFRIYNGTADDLVQQTFLQAFEKLPTLRDQKLLQPWIATIARNNCLSVFRSRKFVGIESLSAEPAGNEFELGLWFDPESGEADIELEQNLELLDRLLAEYRKEPRGRIARLFYLEGQTTREIASRIQLPQNTVLSHLMLFRREMKAALIRLSLEKEQGGPKLPLREPGKV